MRHDFVKWCPIFSVGLLSGCGAIAQAVRDGGTILAGAPPPDPAVIGTVTSWLPEPAQSIAVLIGGALIGAWGAWYRRKLLITPPPTGI